MMDRGNCPKHVEFNFKNKFEKLVHLVGFIIRNTGKTRLMILNFVTKIASQLQKRIVALVA